MKKLGKLKLNNFSEMSEQEMKFVVGVQFDPSAKKKCEESLYTCNGVCPPKYGTSYGTSTLISQTCTPQKDFMTKKVVSCFCS